jgi:molybdopterin biosynthesis enzyme
MPEFLLLSPPLDAFHTFFLALPDKEPTQEEIKTSDSLGRVLCEVVTAPHPLPEFPLSTVDGYAVRARDTFGADAVVMLEKTQNII